LWSDVEASLSVVFKVCFWSAIAEVCAAQQPPRTTGRNRPTADFEDLMECLRTMKIDFSLLDSSIIETLVKGPLKLDDLLAVAAVRDQALRLNIRRAGVSPSNSADTTINERLQVLRRSSQVAYDRPTSRWDVLRVISS
jgi:hypothetical protein